jgi:signal transduction histidine kinase
MTVVPHLLSPRDEAFERVEALAGIARTVIDVRLLLGLLTAVWLLLRDTEPAVMLGMAAAMGWLLLVLLRWRSVGRLLCTHPFVLAADAALCFAALAATEAMSPFLLLAGSGALMIGLCLDRRGAAVFAPLLTAGWWLAYTVRPPASMSTPDVFVQLVGVPALLAGLGFLGAGIRGVVLRAADTERRLREEMRTAGVAEERARMAREMHDSLLKSLHGLALVADTVPAWIDRAPDRAQQQARRLSEEIRVAGRESRELVLAMRRADARDGLADQVRQSVERWRGTTGRQVTLRAEPAGDEPDLSTAAAYELVAILNEALENVRRHTPEPTAVEVVLDGEHGWTRLRVVDNGPGMPRDRAQEGRPGHFGLLGMRERAARAGGRLTVSSRPGVGTTVEVRMPGSAEDDGEQGPGR